MRQSKQKEKLDAYLDYLRTAFNTCYYCQATFDFQQELLHRCARHVRAADDESQTPAQKQQGSCSPCRTSAHWLTL